ncbi:hypothetical protein ACHAQH_006624 [Verticillium albo-atrum]
MYSPIAQPVLDHRFQVSFREQCLTTQAALAAAKASWLRVKDDFSAFAQTPAHEEERTKYADIYAEAELMVEKKEGKLRNRLRKKLRNETDEQVTIRHDGAVALKFYPKLIDHLVRELDAYTACQEAVIGRRQRLGCGKKMLHGRELVLKQLRACRIHLDRFVGDKTEMFKEWTSIEAEVLASLKGKKLCSKCKNPSCSREHKKAEEAEHAGQSPADPAMENTVTVGPAGESSVAASPAETEALKNLKATRAVLMQDLDIFNRFVAILKEEEKAMAEHVKWLLEMDIKRIFNNERVKAGVELLA